MELLEGEEDRITDENIDIFDAEDFSLGDLLLMNRACG